jgi:hypothetical protein
MIQEMKHVYRAGSLSGVAIILGSVALAAAGKLIGL